MSINPFIAALFEIMKDFGSFIMLILPEAIGALIGVLGALKIFQRQLKSDSEKEKVLTKNDQINNLRFQSILISSLIQTIDKQIPELRARAESINNFPENRLAKLSAFPYQDVERLKILLTNKNTSSSYLSFFENDKESMIEYDQISKAIDYFEKGYERLFDTVQNANNYDHERRAQYADLTVKSMNELKDYCYSNITHLIDFLVIMVPYKIIYGGRNDISEHFDELIAPLIFLIESNFNTDTKLKKLEFEFRQGASIIYHIVENNKSHADEIIAFADDFKTTNDALIKNSKRLLDNLTIHQF